MIIFKAGESMDKFRWAYIGSGSIARNTARSITKGSHEITAVFSRNTEKAEEFADKYGSSAFTTFEELISSNCFDGVYIATPHTAHIDYALGAMETGFPVLCEKPIGINADQADRMINCSKENGVYFCEAMWTWFSPLAYKVKEWIDEKRTGKIRSVHMEYAFPGVMMNKNSRLLMPETAGGALLDIGVYPITYCYRLFGFPKRIDCKGNVRNGIDIEEKVILGYDGFDCTLDIALTKLGEHCRIKGTEGTITIPVFHVAKSATLRNGLKHETVSGKTDYLTEFSEAAEEIRSGKKESEFVPHKATLDCLRIMDECRRQMGLVYPCEK